MNYRKAILEDIDELVALRKQQLADEGIKASIIIDDELKTFLSNSWKTIQ